MATTADFKNGLCIVYNNELWTIVEFQHVKPGKGNTFVRTKIKHIKSGRVQEVRFDAGIKIEVARVERRPYIYSYKMGETYIFMHAETFEELSIEESMINNPGLLKEGQSVEIMYHTESDTPLTCELPTYVDLEIIESDPGVKGDTATNALKRAVVETGADVYVPLFINVGDKIKVDTRNNKYSERVKE